MPGEWVPVTEDFPQHDQHYKNISVDVIAKTKHGQLINAFFSHDGCEWYDSETAHRIRDDIIAWKSKEV